MTNRTTFANIYTTMSDSMLQRENPSARSETMKLPQIQQNWNPEPLKWTRISIQPYTKPTKTTRNPSRINPKPPKMNPPINFRWSRASKSTSERFPKHIGSLQRTPGRQFAPNLEPTWRVFLIKNQFSAIPNYKKKKNRIK